MIHEKSYIDPDIQIKEPLPMNIQSLIKELEEFDRAGQWWLYFERNYDLWVNAKNAYVAGDISKRTWDELTKKYMTYSEKIYHEENPSNEGTRF